MASALGALSAVAQLFNFPGEGGTREVLANTNVIWVVQSSLKEGNGDCK